MISATHQIWSESPEVLQFINLEGIKLSCLEYRLYVSLYLLRFEMIQGQSMIQIFKANSLADWYCLVLNTFEYSNNVSSLELESFAGPIYMRVCVRV